MQGKVDCWQVRGGRLRLVAIRPRRAANAPPDVDLVRQFERNLEVAVRNAVEYWTMRLPISGRLVAGCKRIYGQGRKVIRPVVAEDCARLGVLGLVGLQVLVRDADRLFEHIQLLVLKYL